MTRLIVIATLIVIANCATLEQQLSCDFNGGTWCDFRPQSGGMYSPEWTFVHDEQLNVTVVEWRNQWSGYINSVHFNLKQFRTPHCMSIKYRLAEPTSRMQVTLNPLAEVASTLFEDQGTNNEFTRNQYKTLRINIWSGISESDNHLTVIGWKGPEDIVRFASIVTKKGICPNYPVTTPDFTTVAPNQVNFECSTKDGSGSVPAYRRCDGVSDCYPNSEDELNCAIKCDDQGSGVYCPRATGDVCLSDTSKFCDGVLDCDNGVDEDPQWCGDRTCFPYQQITYCISGTCSWQGVYSKCECPWGPVQGKRCQRPPRRR